MASESEITGLLTEMRGSDTNERNNEKAEVEEIKIFEDYLPRAWGMLELEGEPSLVSLEALLIQAIENTTIYEKKNLSEAKYKVAVRRKDVGFLSLGLLDGYYHTINGTNNLASERHKKYLDDNSDFIPVMYFESSPPNCYDRDTYYAKARILISKDDERCRVKLGQYLSKKENCEKCLKEGIKNHTQEIELADGTADRCIILPKICYTLETFPLRPFAEQQGDKEFQVVRDGCEGDGLDDLTPPNEDSEVEENTSVNPISAVRKFISRALHATIESKTAAVAIAIAIAALPMMIIVVICIAELWAILCTYNDSLPPETEEQSQYEIDPTPSLEVEPDQEANDDSDNTVVSFTELELAVQDEDMQELIANAQQPITCLNESGEYDLLAMHNLVMDRIVSNPVYGDMVARGIIVSNGMGRWIGDYSFQKLCNNIEKTNNEGIKPWANCSNSLIFVTDDYVKYAYMLINLTPSYNCVGVFDMESIFNCSMPLGIEGIYAHAEGNEEQVSGPALIYQKLEGEQKVLATYGFYLEDGRFAIYNPARLSSDEKK